MRIKQPVSARPGVPGSLDTCLKLNQHREGSCNIAYFEPFKIHSDCPVRNQGVHANPSQDAQRCSCSWRNRNETPNASLNKTTIGYQAADGMGAECCHGDSRYWLDSGTPPREATTEMRWRSARWLRHILSGQGPQSRELRQACEQHAPTERRPLRRHAIAQVNISPPEHSMSQGH